MRKIAVVSTSRADYGHLYWVLRDLDDHPQIDLRLIVTGAHLSHEFGATAGEIEADGFVIDERIECLLSSDSDVGMAKTIGVATLGLAEVLGRMRPDLLLLIADRYEMLAPAAVALALRIPIAHIEGGEISAGAIDDAVRDGLTKLSHIHFAPTEVAAERVRRMGEHPSRVHRVGAPSLDHLVRRPPLATAELTSRLGRDLADGTLLVSYHPVTLARETLREVDELFAALQRTDRPIVFCFPNADAGSRALIDRAREFCAQRPAASLHVNLNPETYWALLRRVDLMLGNSSSGIMESPALALPTVNVGLRQHGRERACNIIDAPACREAILDALHRASRADFRASLVGMANPYGDGQAAGRICRVLAASPLGEPLLRKREAVPWIGPAPQA